MRSAGLNEAEAGINIAGGNINNLKYIDDTTLMSESEAELKSLLMKVKEETEKVGLKLSIQKTKIMGSGPIISWQIDEETMETVRNFILGGSRITADGDCGHEIKRCLQLGRIVMSKLDRILKSRDITLPTKVCLVKAMVFPVVMNGCESWTIKKAECWKIYVFELWCWRRLLRAPWTARRSSQSILKEISPECSLEGLMLKLKLQCSGHLMQRADSLEIPLMLETLKEGGEGEDRGWDGWMAPLTWWTWVWVNSGSCWWTGRPGVPLSMASQSIGVNRTEQPSVTPYPEPWGEESQGVKAKEAGPRRRGAYQRNDFSEPRLLHLPLHRKALNSQTWVICFTLINNNHLMPTVPALCCQHPAPTTTATASWSSSLRVTWDAVSRTWRPKNLCWLKHESQLSGCEYFLNRQWQVL